MGPVCARGSERKFACADSRASTWGGVSAWYDATEYFADLSSANRFTPTRDLSETLFHAASEIAFQGSAPQGSVARIELTRTAAMVLALYMAPARPTRMQIEIDEEPVALFGRAIKEPRRLIAFRFGWLTTPTNLAALPQ